MSEVNGTDMSSDSTEWSESLSESADEIDEYNQEHPYVRLVKNSALSPLVECSHEDDEEDGIGKR